MHSQSETNGSPKQNAGGHVSFFRYLADVWLVSSAFAAVCAVTGIKLYFGNINEFGFPLQDLIRPTFYVFTLLFCIIGLILLACWRFPIYRGIVSIFLYLVILFWVQSTFLLWHYGMLDGSPIPWKHFADKEVWEAAIWAGLLIFGMIFYQRTYRIMPYVLTILTIMMIADGWIVQNKAPIPDLDKLYVADESSKFVFSSEKNVLVLILDAFQGSVFDEIIETTPQYADMLDGFTFYRNAMCAIPSTKLSIPNILTGMVYDNTIPVRQYQRQGLLTHSLPLSLRALGFGTEFYSFFGYGILPLDDRLWSNERRATSLQEHASEYVKLLYTTAFRLSPQILKKEIYQQGKWVNTPEVTTYVKDIVMRVEGHNVPGDSKQSAGSASAATVPGASAQLIQCCGNVPAGSYYDIDFLNGMLNHARIGGEKHSFKLYHLQGLHPPRNFDENFHFDPAYNESVESIPSSGRASLLIMGMFLNKLKEMGIYDSSVIVVLADHGNALAINPSKSEHNRELNTKSMRLSFDSVKGTAVPLVLIKPANSKGAMKISDVPVVLGDIPDTIMNAIGKSEDFPGKSMLRNQKENRKRFYYVHAYHEMTKDYYGDLQEFEVDGDVYKDESWHLTGRLLKPKESSQSKYDEERSNYLQQMLPLKPLEGGQAFAEPEFGYLNGSCSAAKACDRNRETGWMPIISSNGPCTPHGILGIKLDKPSALNAYSLKTRWDLQYQAPRTWTFEGSEDGKAWTVLHTVQDDTHWEPGGKVRVFIIDNQRPFNYYRINITAAQDGRCIFIDELELFE